MIIGLSGYARSGKNTVAEILVTQHGFESVSFADPIRSMLYALNPVVDGEKLADLIDNYGWEIAKSKTDVRIFLQALGYSGRVHVNQDIWIMAAFGKMRVDKNYVIADVRFKNEAEAILSHEGLIWRVQRPGVEPVNTHISEWEMDDFNFDNILLNDGNIEQLEFLVKKLYDKTI